VQKRLDEEGELDKAAYEAIKALEAEAPGH
jgi:hypothetical protein